MSLQDDRINAIQGQLNNLYNMRRVLRERELSLNARNQYLSTNPTMQATTVQDLRQSLLGNLPPHMMPGNVGGINEVTWPFLFQMNFDIGDNPVIKQNNITKSFFQVDQEAALLLMAFSRAHNTDANGSSATVTAPLSIQFVDRQSTRNFQSQPIPLQTIGFNSCPSIFPTPMYIQPNAFLDGIIDGIPLLPQNFNGSGSVQLSFFGYRIRTEDAGKVLSTIFQQL